MIISLTIQLATGFFAAFIAILSWSKTREGSWLFMIGGILFQYLNLLYEIMVRLNVLSTEMGQLKGFPLVETAFKIAPFLFYIIGFSIFLWKKRKF